MGNLIVRFQEIVQQHHLFNKRDRLLLAVSGGVDSVVLTECCFRSGFDFVIAHVNFQLRSEESGRDEEFVKGMAAGYGKPFLVKRMDTPEYAKKKGVSIQVAARDLRYRWFEEILQNDPGRYHFLLTAHHLDDNIETMLMHFFRGTGIAGIRAMQEKQGKIIRPLLSFSKTEIKSFAGEQKLSWVEDSSNEADKYTRNYFRNKLIPEIEKVFPEVRNNLEGNLRRFTETEILYRQAIEQHKKKLMKRVGEEVHIPILLLKKTKPLQTVLFEILQEFGFSSAQAGESLKLMDSHNGKYISGDTHRIIKNRAWLIIAPLQHPEATRYIIEKENEKINFPGGELILKTLKTTSLAETEKSTAIAFLDANQISFPLILRKWKAGDYFYPLGMKKKKKIARFLIDQKLSKTVKEKVRVLEMDQRIIWVVGHRIDDRFRLTPTTKKILKIEMRVT